jgi:Ca2+-binding RTX toxin-like protein
VTGDGNDFLPLAQGNDTGIGGSGNDLLVGDIPNMAAENGLRVAGLAVEDLAEGGQGSANRPPVSLAGRESRASGSTMAVAIRQVARGLAGNR